MLIKVVVFFYFYLLLPFDEGMGAILATPEVGHQRNISVKLF